MYNPKFLFYLGDSGYAYRVSLPSSHCLEEEKGTLQNCVVITINNLLIDL
jgi:hypothetical protein